MPARHRSDRPGAGRRRGAQAPAGAVPGRAVRRPAVAARPGSSPGLRAHLWFMLDRPLVRRRAQVRWLGRVPGVDLQVFVPGPAALRAPPDLRRTSTIRARRAAGACCPASTRSRCRTCRSRSGHGRRSPRPAIGDGLGPARAERYAAACLRRLALAPEGRRHPTCVAVSCRLLALAKAGLLDPIRVAGQIKGVMLGRGFDGRHAAAT